jgi:hypothetical protein
MNEIDSGRPRSLRDRLRLGEPVIDRFGMLWWLVEVAEPGPRLACGLTAQAAQASTNRRGSVHFDELAQTAGPLRPRE